MSGGLAEGRRPALGAVGELGRALALRTVSAADAVVCNFNDSPDSIRISAALLFDAVETAPTTRMPIKL